jgi:hypothetical protein
MPDQHAQEITEALAALSRGARDRRMARAWLREALCDDVA